MESDLKVKAKVGKMSTMCSFLFTFYKKIRKYFKLVFEFGLAMSLITSNELHEKKKSKVIEVKK
ncbi:hypothetical protein KSS87_023020 [Heliosperma pusillum]|nr:hypothetical protein KSS87_020175 [Heliosperma pusillum]KAH9622052.1 hypothetical protein KSS87_023020 [Heliosperma pusillum]